MSPRTGPRTLPALAAACAGLLALTAASAFGAAPPPPEPGAPDAIGRPVSPEARAAYERFADFARDQDLSDVEYQFVLTALNLPAIDPGPFRDREELARYFVKAGVRVGQVREDGLTGTDLWRLVRAVRAASQAYRIPPAILMCLTFCESGFNRGASAWTTSAKGVAQMTNPAVADAIKLIRWNPALAAATKDYAAQLGAKMPDRLVGAPDVDALTLQLDALVQRKAPPAEVRRKRLERQKAIKAHKDEVGHIYNIETNFGLAATHLAYLRHRRLREVPDERKGWLSAVGAYNQGIGYANALIKIAGGPAEFDRRGLDEVFGRKAIFQLDLPRDFKQEMLDEISAVRSCAIP
ncbi:MAG: hypothetical protein HY927_07170 [Elusimicrobia bacterium]|nr:hypothetical protein [Elusimicrobiota bacterium]